MSSTTASSNLPHRGFELTGKPAPIGTLLGDVWRYRRLLAILARKEFFVKFRRASLGMAWAVLLPLIQAVVMAVVLSHFVKFKTGINYPVFVFTGTLVWSYFSMSLSVGAGSIVDAHDMSTKVYFPRSLFPLVAVVSNIYGAVLSTVVLVALALVVGVGLDYHVLLIVPALVLTILLTAGFALVLAIMQVYFRDMRYVVNAALTAWIYATPVFYQLSLLGRLRPWVEANPATGAVEMFRAGIGGADHGWEIPILWTIGWTIALFALALVLYRRYDRVCTDLL